MVCGWPPSIKAVGTGTWKWPLITSSNCSRDMEATGVDRSTVEGGVVERGDHAGTSSWTGGCGGVVLEVE